MTQRIITLFITAAMLLSGSVLPAAASVRSTASKTEPSGFCDGVSEIPTSECNALEALYNSTNGAGWTDHSGWMETTTPCNWYGITCTSEHIRVIDLRNNQLSGTLPAQIGDFPFMEWLYVEQNNISGNIPPEIGNLSHLFGFLSNYNQLSGNIPAEFGNLPVIQYIDLFTNDLSGNIPPELGNLSNLRELNLGSNQLSGSIPPFLGNINSLNDLNLNQNQFTGTIPSELGNLVNLVTLDLSFNQISGMIPASLGNLTSLHKLYLGLNQLQGSIPPELGKLTQLEWLSLDGNHLGGVIPSELGNLSNLGILQLSGVELQGNIPSSFVNLTNLWYLDLADNQLTGSIPPELGNMPNLAYLFLCINQLSGNIPPELVNLSNLRELNLGSNQLSGSIPPELGDLSFLDYLNLSGNQLQDSIPPELGNLANLQALYLYNNLLSGIIPPEIGNLSKMDGLRLENNRLSGSLPSELGILTNLQILFLVNNQLDGEIPASLTNLASLKYLNIGYNKLISTDPEVITFLDTLEPDWANSQTITPTDLHVAGTDGAVQLSWSSIPYTQDDGGYEISYATSETGPFTVHGMTANKSTSTYMVYGLDPGTPYFFQLRTHTPAHDLQQNDLWSDYSSPVSGTPSQAPVQADFNADPTSGIMPVEVAFTNASTGIYSSCDWSFGDGETSSECNPLHTYASTGIFPVSLTVNGTGGTSSLDKAAFIAVGAQAEVTPIDGGDLVYTDTTGAQTEIQVPAGGVDSTVTLEFNPVATANAPANLSFAGHAFDLSAYQNNEILENFAFQEPVTVTIHYTDADVSTLDENGLILYFWDAAADAWTDAASSCTPTSTYIRNPEENWLSLPICHLSKFSLFGTSQFQLFLPLVVR